MKYNVDGRCRVKWTFTRSFTAAPRPISAREARKLIGDYWFRQGREQACQIGVAQFSDLSISKLEPGMMLVARSEERHG